jgi:hypothetical protein
MGGYNSMIPFFEDVKNSILAVLGLRTDAAATTVNNTNTLMSNAKGTLQHLINNAGATRMTNIDTRTNTTNTNVQTLLNANNGNGLRANGIRRIQRIGIHGNYASEGGTVTIQEPTGSWAIFPTNIVYTSNLPQSSSPANAIPNVNGNQFTLTGGVNNAYHEFTIIEYY